jgi:hypothetical protein
MVSACLHFESLDALLASIVTSQAKIGQNGWDTELGSFALFLLKGRDYDVKVNQNFSRNLVATELSQKLLLGRQIQVLVVHNLVPNALSINGETIGRNSSVILGEEETTLELLVTVQTRFAVSVSSGEPRSKLLDLLGELISLKDLVRQGSKAKVEVVLDARTLEPLRLGDGRPNLSQVLNQGGSEVAQGCSAKMIANDEE